MEPNIEDKKDNLINQSDFITFLKDKEIDIEGNKEKLFESFLLFQKFMRCMLGKHSTELKDSNNQEPGFSLNNTTERKNTCSYQFINDSKLTEEIKIIQEEKPKDKELNYNSPINKDKEMSQKYSETIEHKTYLNYDDIPIKPSQINFVELVEKNLNELQYQPVIKNDNVERKIFKHFEKNKNIKIPKDKRISQSTQNTNKNKKSHSPSDNNERTHSHPKKKKSKPALRKPKLSNQIKEEIKDEDEEKPKDLPIFIKEKEEDVSLKLNEQNISVVAPEEQNKKETIETILNYDSLNMISPQKKTYHKPHQPKKNDKKKVDSDSDEIIDNSDSYHEEEKNKNEKEQKRLLIKEKNKQLIEELNIIKGNATTIINNPIYSSAQKFHNKRRNSFNNNNKSNKKDDNIPNKDLIDYEKEIAKLKEENIKVSQLMKEYKEMKQSLQREIDLFNIKKKKEYSEIEKIKNEELAKVNKLKLTKPYNIQTSMKQNQENQSLINKKDKEEIEQLKSQILKLNEERKIKDNVNKTSLDKLKKQLQEANTQISILVKSSKGANPPQFKNDLNNNTYRNAISNTIPNFNRKEKSLPNKNDFMRNTSATLSKGKKIIQSGSNNIKIIKDDPSVGTFELSFPSKYNLGKNDVIIKDEQLGEGKQMITYSNQMKEIIFPSGVKKKIYQDGYQVIFFINNDIKQIFPDGKIVYYFSEAKITQTTFPNNLHVYLFPNGQIEKHYPDGKKEIINKPQLFNQNTSPKSNKQKKKKTNEEVIFSNKINNSLVKMKTIKNKDGSELYEFV